MSIPPGANQGPPLTTPPEASHRGLICLHSVDTRTIQNYAYLKRPNINTTVEPKNRRRSPPAAPGRWGGEEKVYQSDTTSLMQKPSFAGPALTCRPTSPRYSHQSLSAAPLCASVLRQYHPLKATWTLSSPNWKSARAHLLAMKYPTPPY